MKFLKGWELKYELRINSRKILAALAELCGGAEKMMNITIAIDKLDKIGLEKVKEELEQQGLAQQQMISLKIICLSKAAMKKNLIAVEDIIYK